MPNGTGARCPGHCLMAIMAGWHRYRNGERSTVALPDVAVPPHSAPPVVRGTATRAHPRHPKGEPAATDVTHECSSLKAQVADMLCWSARWLADPPSHTDVGEGLIAVPLPVLAAAAILRGDPSIPPGFPAGLFPLPVPESA